MTFLMSNPELLLIAPPVLFLCWAAHVMFRHRQIPSVLYSVEPEEGRRRC